jgi:hypothetical protein
MRATDIATNIAAATAFSAPPLVGCQADASEQEQIASAFVSAAIRLGRDLPAERAERPPYTGPALRPYIGRHRRGATVRSGAELQAAQS